MYKISVFRINHVWLTKTYAMLMNFDEFILEEKDIK